MLNQLRAWIKGPQPKQLVVIRRGSMSADEKVRMESMNYVIVEADNPTDVRMVVDYTQPIGDGKAEFLSDMDEGELEEYTKNEINGWKRFKPWA